MTSKNLETASKIALWLTFLVGMALFATEFNIPTWLLMIAGGILGGLFAMWIGIRFL